MKIGLYLMIFCFNSSHKKFCCGNNCFMNKTKYNLLCVAGGSVVGVINGFLGAGGGMIVVPLYSKVLNIENKKSHATAVLTILPICAISSIAYITSGVVELMPTIWVTIGSLIGALVGTFLLCKLKTKIISIMFNGLMLAAGIMMILQIK